MGDELGARTIDVFSTPAPAAMIGWITSGSEPAPEGEVESGTKLAWRGVTSDMRKLITPPHRIAPNVLLVGMGNPHEELCRQCAEHAAGARLEVCDVASLITRAAELRPLAIIVPSHILAFDAAEFSALARTVGAVLIPLSSDLPVGEVGDNLIGTIFAAAERRGNA